MSKIQLSLVKVVKWGRSLAVRIPSRFARVRRIKVGMTIDLEAVRVVKPRRRYKLSEMMVGYKSKRRHGEWDLGAPVGREIW